MSSDKNKNGCAKVNIQTSAEISENMNQGTSEGMSENMGISALLDDEMSSAEFAILSAQFGANPAMISTLKTHRYVLDALAGFVSPDYFYTERIMAYIQHSISTQ